jgi:bifunctional non-homologous end joining protein LigD
MSTATALNKKITITTGTATPSIDLHYIGGGSDKVYHAAIRQSGDDTYMVQFAFGRRGSSLALGTKTTTPVSLDKATTIYNKLVAEKVGKGYRESPGISGNIFGPPVPAGQTVNIPQKEASGVFPQLCNECMEEDVGRLIKDPAWGAQEKLDGKRKLVRRSSEVQGINKKGFVVPLLPEIIRAIDALKVPVLLDGEEIGNVYHVFGLLELTGRDLRGLSYIETYWVLEKVLRKSPSDALSLVELATTEKQKRALFNKLKAGNKEGIVFKRLAASYSPGKPASGGDHLKFKFWSDASVIVLSVNSKRSVRMGVLTSPGGTTVTIGNVSIPANYDIPRAGDIIDVRYLYANRGGCLYQPQYRGKRDDVAMEECLETRIKYKA